MNFPELRTKKRTNERTYKRTKKNRKLYTRRHKCQGYNMSIAACSPWQGCWFITKCALPVSTDAPTGKFSIIRRLATLHEHMYKIRGPSGDINPRLDTIS